MPTSRLAQDKLARAVVDDIGATNVASNVQAGGFRARRVARSL